MKSPETETDPLPLFREPGILLQHQIIDRELIEDFKETADQFYQRTQSQSPQSIQKSLPAGQKYVPTASSFSLEAVFDPADCRRILRAIANSSTGDAIERALAGMPLCDLDQSWVRRQYAPSRYPPLHAPHAWHQDGALRYDFKAPASTMVSESGLLSMLTCWIPLVPCGENAPGLEFVAVPVDELLAPASLLDQSIRSTHASEKFWKPSMHPGDIVLFRSGVIHRTHVTTAMQSDRTSIELRFVAENRIPLRLAEDRFALLE